MLEPTAGEPVERERNLYETFLRRLTDAEQQRVSDQLASGLQLLRNHTGWLTMDSQPLAIVKTIKAVVNEYCQRHPFPSKLKEDEPLLSLGWLWTEQLCRAYQWQWLARDTEGSITIGVFSPGQVYESHPPAVIKWHLMDIKGEDGILDLFRRLAHIAKPGQLAHAYGSGWIRYNRHPDKIVDP